MNIEKLVAPRSIAIIGASDRRSLGRIILESLGRIGFNGPIYPINPKYGSVLNHHCYPSLADLPEAADLARLCVSSTRVKEQLELAINGGVKRVSTRGVSMPICRWPAAALLLLLPFAPATAQEKSETTDTYPNRGVRIVVPFPAGGPTDILSRIVAQKMSETWNQPVVIENRPGANTAIGAQIVARAAPDGYTLLAAMDSTLVMNPATTSALPYDPFKDFAAITLAAKNTSLLTVRAADGPRSVKELIAKGRANPGKMNYGAGIAITRLAGYLFSKMAGFDAVLIPYKGSAEVVHGLLSGSVDFIVDGTASSLPLIQAGQFRALAKLNTSPLPPLPDLPTLAAAADLLNLEDMSSWIGFVAPAGTRRPIIDKIRMEIERIYADPAIAKKLENAGINAVTSTPEEFDAFYRQEADRWTKVFKESGIKLD